MPRKPLCFSLAPDLSWFVFEGFSLVCDVGEIGKYGSLGFGVSCYEAHRLVSGHSLAFSDLNLVIVLDDWDCIR